MTWRGTPHRSRSNRPAEFLFGATDVATTVELAALSQGMLAVSMPGMTRHAQVEIADLDPLDRHCTLGQ